MSKIENGIGWCDATTNAVTGCTEVSPGCARCYAKVGTRARVLRFQGRETWGAKGERVPVNFEPAFRRLNKLCVCDKCHKSYPVNLLSTQTLHDDQNRPTWCFDCGGKLRRIRLFADSNSDWLDHKWPVETLARFQDAIRLAPNVDVQLLTKRMENWRYRMLEARNAEGMSQEFRYWMDDWYSGIAPKNVRLGVSVEDQKRADERRDVFKDVEASVKFVSYEPALEYVCWDGWEFVDQIIAGGESGKNRRSCEIHWFEKTAAWCDRNGVAFYMKQDGHLLPGKQGRIPHSLWARKEFPTLKPQGAFL